MEGELQPRSDHTTTGGETHQRAPRKRGTSPWNDPSLIRQVPGGWIVNRRWFRTEWAAITYLSNRDGTPPPSVPTDPPRELGPLPFAAEDVQAVDWIYFLQVKGGGPIKIGTATHVPSRVAGIQCGHWQELVILGVTRGDSKYERLLHNHFARDWIRGEWFRDSAELRNAIDALCRPAAA